MEKVYDYEDIKEICILDYYPSKLQGMMELTPEQMVVSQFVIDFKNGHRPASILAAKMVAKIIGKHFELDKEPVVFIPVPASTREDTAKRYSLFSYLVSQHCHVTDGHRWVNNWREVEKKHLSQDHKINDDKNRWFIDYSKVKGARVIIFDDVATTGETSADFIRRLEECGAKVIGKVFLANSYFWKVHQKEKEGQP